MKQPTILLLIALCIVAQNNLRAQAPGAVQQVESVRLREQNELSAKSYNEGDSVPEISPDEGSDAGPQSVLRIKQRKTYFEAMADAQYFYTDNMFLGDDFKKSADVLVSTVQIALAPTPYDLAGGKFAPRVGYRHQWFDYGLISRDKVDVLDLGNLNTGKVRLNEFDFNAQTFFTDMRWSRDKWTAWLGFDFTRLLSTSSYNQFYEEYVPRWGLQRSFTVNDNAAFSLGYMGDYRFTSVDTIPPVRDDDANDRTDHSLFAAWTQTLCKHALVQPYYRFTYTRFIVPTMTLRPSDFRLVSNDRNDYLHSLGIALYYFITPNISARVFVSYDLRESDAAQDYAKLDAGGGVNFTLKF